MKKKHPKTEFQKYKSILAKLDNKLKKNVQIHSTES